MAINYAVAFMGDSSDVYLSGTFSVEEVDGEFTVTAVDITITNGSSSYTFGLLNASLVTSGEGSEFLLQLSSPQEEQPFLATASVEYSDSLPYGDPTIVFTFAGNAFFYFEQGVDTFDVIGSQGEIVEGFDIPSPCFTPDTFISTPTGRIAVQDLNIGDLILNHMGYAVPVKWIGTRRCHQAFAQGSLPICIRAGALGRDLPLRDLFVSPCHALYIDDCLLIQAKALVNGVSIFQVTRWEGELQYFHIETEDHEIILAEGAPAETFMDNISRACFNNYSEYPALYPEAHEMIELDLPRVCHQRQLPNMVKRTLEEIAEGLMGQEKVQMVG